MRRACLVAFAAFAACGPLEPFPKLVQPINRCSESECSLYATYDSRYAQAACVEGACRVTATIDDLVYAVSLPRTSYFAPGVTFLLSERAVRLGSVPCGLAVPCFPLPLALRAEGQYVPGSTLVGSILRTDLGNGLATTSLPVSATYFPFVQLRDGRLADAAALGIGAPQIVANKVTFEKTLAGPGPFGGQSPGFLATLAPGFYGRSIVPEDAFDVFPPDTRGTDRALTIEQGGAFFERVALDEVDLTPSVGGDLAAPEFTILREGGNLDGWSTYLRETTTGRRISSRARLAGQQLRVRFLAHRSPADKDALSHAELVVIPTNPELPTLVVFKQAGQPFDRVEYPAIPKPARVSGRVLYEGSPVVADVVIRSERVYISDPELEFSQSLSWSTTLSTDRDGLFATTLPRGEYKLTLVPRAPGLATTQTTMLVDLVNEVQAGKSFTVGSGLTVRGVARVSDGRALAGAEIEFVAAAASRDLNHAPPLVTLRAARTTTSSDGTFELVADAGTYDLVVRPASGSGLPWIVRSDVEISVADRKREAIEVSVPAPIQLSMALRDPAGNPIPWAWVRVYAPADGAVVPIEIARGLSDTNGVVVLLGAGAPHSGKPTQTYINAAPTPPISSSVHPQADAGTSH